jgi:glycosyltransferase involved in cell wall biosynthesis
MTISVVIPLYNEEENVRELYGRLKPVMESLRNEYEIIFIDDGSTDNTLSLLQGIQAADDSVIILSLRRNFGQTAAFAAGFDYSRGDIIVTMDGDLQNDPQDIPKLLDLMKDNDLVSGWRKKERPLPVEKAPFYSRQFSDQ